MSTVIVPIPGTAKELVLETDPATGRTAGRIDGRAVMSPLGAHEDEREFKVGSYRYLLRRLPDGDFDVDIAPPEIGTGAAWTPPVPSLPQPQSPKKKSGFVIGGLTATLLLVLGGRIVSRGVKTFTRSWSEPIEITSFTCKPLETKGQFPEFEAIVDLTNRSSRPLALTGHLTIIGPGRSNQDYQGAVKPSPLEPDQSGRLYIRGYTPDSMRFGDGQCELNAFRNAEGKVVGYREAGK